MNELALFAGAGGGILGGKLLGWRTVCADLLEHGCIDDEGHHLQYAKEIRARGEQAWK